MPDYLLRLFVNGHSAATRAAVDDLHRLCDERFPSQYEIEVVDVQTHPELAEHDRILATPTLIRRLPPPIRRVIGSLTDAQRVLEGLDLVPLDGDGHHGHRQEGAPR